MSARGTIQVECVTDKTVQYIHYLTSAHVQSISKDVEDRAARQEEKSSEENYRCRASRGLVGQSHMLGTGLNGGRSSAV